ncbi:MAG: hypothetical protein K2X27_09610 [Candidatus Obscuribacterales bacterium]|nr:hypothetical protein [Candidatus Obscuribacterales bacterium]
MTKIRLLAPNNRAHLFKQSAILLSLTMLVSCSPLQTASPKKQIATPVAGLTAQQKSKFERCAKTFQHEFTAQEGLGPVYNAKSCASCHDSEQSNSNDLAAIENKNSLASRSLILFASRKDPKASKSLLKSSATLRDVHFYENQGMGLVEKHSLSESIAALKDCKVETIGIPKDCDFVSTRIARSLDGVGLINAIPDNQIDKLEEQQLELDVDAVGRVLDRKDRLTFESRINRFGQKCIESNLLMVAADMMNDAIGISSPSNPKVRAPGGESKLPTCLSSFVASEPNDNGKIQAELTYYMSLLAAPERGKITPAVKRGEQTFEKLGCAFCHVPELRSAEKVTVVDPDSKFPDLDFIEIEALENKPVAAYSDFLVHHMGNDLADGIPEGRASASEWRTAPLWGIRKRKQYLHDGRAKSLSEAIMLHGGQAEQAAASFNALCETEKNELLEFLQSL